MISVMCRPSVAVTFPHSLIRPSRQSEQGIEKRVALAIKQPRAGQEMGGSGGPSQWYGSRANDRTERQICTDKLARPQHDQVRRGRFIQVEVRKDQPVAAINRRRVAHLIMPNLEVGHL